RCSDRSGPCLGSHTAAPAIGPGCRRCSPRTCERTVERSGALGTCQRGYPARGSERVYETAGLVGLRSRSTARRGCDHWIDPVQSPANLLSILIVFAAAADPFSIQPSARLSSPSIPSVRTDLPWMSCA